LKGALGKRVVGRAPASGSSREVAPLAPAGLLFHMEGSRVTVPIDRSSSERLSDAP
jgi:hypothetical protein